jgi:DNA-binding XRE family transcriptional regulator
MEYSNLIKKLRHKLILTQSELADLIKVSFSSVNRWENGKHEPTTKIKRKIVELCLMNHINIDELGDKQ